MFGADWKKRVRAWRTYSWLSKSEMSATNTGRLENFTEAQLAAAAQNPDHSEAGRKAAQHRLAQLGGDLSASDIRVPGFVKPQNKEDLRRRFFGVSREIRKWTGVFSILLFIGLIALIGYSEELKFPALQQARDADLITSEELYDRGRKLTREEIENVRSVKPDLLETNPSDTTLETILLERARDLPLAKKQRRWERIGEFSIGVWMLCLAMWFLASIWRRQPARILLLRKFNNKKLGKAMANVITTEMRPFGHVLTLEDKHIKGQSFFGIRWISSNPIYAVVSLPWLPFRMLLRQFDRTKWGPAWVGSARDLRCLAFRLRNRMSLNLEVAWKAKQEAFIVRTSDDWWQEVIALMMHSADVIVVDLSEVTSGTQWELERMDRLQEWRRAVFTAKADRLANARQVLASFAWNNPHIYSYGKLGNMEDQQAFREAMLNAIDERVNNSSETIIARKI